MSGGFSQSGGKSKSDSASQQVNYGSEVWQNQAPYLGDIYSQAQSTMNRQMGNTYVTPQARQVTRLNPNYVAPQQSNAFTDAGFQIGYDPFGRQNPAMTGDYYASLGYAPPSSQTSEPQYITETVQDPGYWQSTGQDSPEVAQAKQLMQQMQGQYGQATGSLNLGGLYNQQAYNQIYGANPNWSQAEGALGQAQQGFQGIANAANGVDPMADVYARLTGQSFREQIMPAIGGEAAQMGGMGSSRQGIAQGLAASRASQQIQDFNAQLYAGQQQRALEANRGLTGVGQGYTGIGQGRVNQGVATGNLGSLQAQLAQGYQNNAQGLAGIAEMGMNLPWYALQQYAGLIGGPTQIDKGGSGVSNSKSRSWNFAHSAQGGAK